MPLLVATGRLEEYPVTVAAHGRNRFFYGPAEVSAEAVIRDRGTIVDEQKWSRTVEFDAPISSP